MPVRRSPPAVSGSAWIVTGPLILALCFVFAVGGLSEQTSAWQPSAGHVQVPIWPGAAPDAQPVTGPETSTKTQGEDLVAGKPYIYIENVSRPTMTVYSPGGKNTGVAVIVFPGGGYEGLAIDLEGTEVCAWLTSKGITCVLLKYRVPHSGPQYDDKCKCQVKPKAPMALQDAQRAMGLIRLHAAEHHIDPHKIGVLGFSAGGHLVADISTHFDKRVYSPVDVADQESCRPDFAVALYPGHLRNGQALSPDISVTRQTPPAFLLHAENDSVDNAYNSVVYYLALMYAGVPAELHLYAEGKHGFGLRRTQYPITRWPELVETWLRTIGVTSK
ncbi:MAG TPA: alpha/beta hydrolase [Bryobacteraceae bacterium]|nr:alpha/beta hydrolase [Bryobacteraceae bacterium]